MAKKVTRGSAVIIEYEFLKKSNRKPFVFEDFQGATGFFLDENGEYQSATGSLKTNNNWVVQFELSSAFTSVMDTGEELDTQVNVQNGDTLSTFVVTGKLNVIEELA